MLAALLSVAIYVSVQRSAQERAARAIVTTHGIVGSEKGPFFNDPAAVQTNIVIFEVPDAPALVAGVADEVELQAVDARRVRAVTHLDIGPADVETTLAVLRRALS